MQHVVVKNYSCRKTFGSSSVDLLCQQTYKMYVQNLCMISNRKIDSVRLSDVMNLKKKKKRAPADLRKGVLAAARWWTLPFRDSTHCRPLPTLFSTLRSHFLAYGPLFCSKGAFGANVYSIWGKRSAKKTHFFGQYFPKSAQNAFFGLFLLRESFICLISELLIPNQKFYICSWFKAINFWIMISFYRCV